MDMYERKRAFGFTLVELLSVISILGILFGIGIPAYRSVTTSSRLSSTINGMLGDMQYARSVALREGRTVTICISTDGESCASGSAWNNGWIVFSDPNNNATVDDHETVLRVQRALSGGDTMTEGQGINAFTFNRSGFALNLPTTGALLTLHDQSFEQNFTRCLDVNVAGLMKTLTHTSAPEICT